jgi:hypothetical protein
MCVWVGVRERGRGRSARNDFDVVVFDNGLTPVLVFQFL